MRTIRLNGEDAAWLHIEEPTNLMVVTAVLELGAGVPYERLSDLVRQRLLSFPPFRARVVEGSRWRRQPYWHVDDKVDLRHHLREVELADDSEAGLRQHVEATLTTPLPRQRPLWHIDIVQSARRGTLLVCRVHHAVADGFALLHVLLSLCDGQAEPLLQPHQPLSEATGILSTAKKMTAIGKSVVQLVASPREPPTPLVGSLGASKTVAWSEPLALAPLKQAARRRHATVNDLLVAATGGALRSYLLARSAGIDRELHAMMPVNLRSREQALAQLGNHFGLMIVPLPVHHADRETRFTTGKSSMDALKQTPQSLAALAILHAIGRAPRMVEKLAVEFFTRKASVVLTNVRGPTVRPTLAGAPLSRVLFWVPQSGRVPLGISLLSLADEAHIGVMGDAQRAPDPRALVTGIEQELAALVGSREALQRTPRPKPQPPLQPQAE